MEGYGEEARTWGLKGRHGTVRLEEWLRPATRGVAAPPTKNARFMGNCPSYANVIYRVLFFKKPLLVVRKRLKRTQQRLTER